MLGSLMYFGLLGVAFGTAIGLYFGLRAVKLI